MGSLVVAAPIKNIRTILEGHTGDVNSVSFSPDGHTLASGSVDGGTVLWDVATQTKISSLDTWGVKCVSFSPDGNTIVSGGSSARRGQDVRMWDVDTQTKIAIFDIPRVNSVVFSPDGRTLASASGSNSYFDYFDIVSLWNVDTQTQIVRHWNISGLSKVYRSVQMEKQS